MLRGLGGGRVGRHRRRCESWLVFQVIDDELDDGCRWYRSLDRCAEAQCVPRTPVLKRSLVGTCRIARLAFVEERVDGLISFLGQLPGVLQRSQRRIEEEGGGSRWGPGLHG